MIIAVVNAILARALAGSNWTCLGWLVRCKGIKSRNDKVALNVLKLCGCAVDRKSVIRVLQDWPYPINLSIGSLPRLGAKGEVLGMKLVSYFREKTAETRGMLHQLSIESTEGLGLNVMTRCGPKKVKINLVNNVRTSRQLRFGGV